MVDHTALVVGASGIIGGNLARELIADGWTVYGLARNPGGDVAGMLPVAADLLEPASVKTALADVAPTHVFLTTWMRNATEAENIEVNSAMVRNVLDALSPKRSVQHVALVTGLKHYLGPFDGYVRRARCRRRRCARSSRGWTSRISTTPRKTRSMPRPPRDGFTWSVHRPHTVIGKAVGNVMNMGTTLAVYASICKETGRPFRWPGSQAQWQGICGRDRRARPGQASGLGLQPPRRPGTRRSTSSMATSSAGTGCGRGWPAWFGVEPIGFDGTVHPLEAADGG